MSEVALGPRHQKVQRLRRLVAQRSARQHARAFVLEGPKLCVAALQQGIELEALYFAPAARDDQSVLELLAEAQLRGVRTFELEPGVMERVADTVTPQPVCGICAFVDRPLEDLLGLETLVVLLEVRDPGNVGAILRSADGAGIGGVVLSEQSADLYNPKTVRASAGSLLSVPVTRSGPPAELLGALGLSGHRRIGTVARGGADYGTFDYQGRIALVFGNESHGLSPALADMVDEALSIPTSAGIESLNVAMAATVLCFEWARSVRATKELGV